MGVLMGVGAVRTEFRDQLTDSIQLWEMIDLGGNNKYAFKSFNNKYLRAGPASERYNVNLADRIGYDVQFTNSLGLGLFLEAFVCVSGIVNPIFTC